VQHLILRELVDQADEFACFEIFCIVALFKIIELLQNRYRNTDVVFVEIKNGIVFVNDDRRVENKNLFFFFLFVCILIIRTYSLTLQSYLCYRQTASQ